MAPLPGALGALPLACAPRLSAALGEEGYAVADGAASEEWCAAVRRDIGALHSGGALQKSLNRVATARAGAAGGGAEGHLCEKKGIHELDIVLNGELVAPAALDAAPALAAWLGDSLGRRERAAQAAAGEGERAGGDAKATAEDEGCAASGCGALMAALNAAAPWLQLTHLVRGHARVPAARHSTRTVLKLTHASRRLLACAQDTLKVQYNEGVGGCFPMHFDTTPAISKRTLTAILCAFPLNYSAFSPH